MPGSGRSDNRSPSEDFTNMHTAMHTAFKTAILALLALAAPMASAKSKSILEQRRSRDIFEIFTALSEGLCGEKHYEKGMSLLPVAFPVDKLDVSGDTAPNSQGTC